MAFSPSTLTDWLRRHWRLLLGLAVLVGGSVLLLSLAGETEVWLQGAAWILLVVCTVLLLAPRPGSAGRPGVDVRHRPHGPRPQPPSPRGLRGVLLAVLFIVYTNYFKRDFIDGLAGIMDEHRLPPSEMAHFAARFFHTFLIVQFLAVLILAPAFTAGAVAEEREKGTLSDLLTTQLLSREIIFGKLASRLSHLILLLLVGVPILSLLQLARRGRSRAGGRDRAHADDLRRRRLAEPALLRPLGPAARRDLPDLRHYCRLPAFHRLLLRRLLLIDQLGNRCRKAFSDSSIPATSWGPTTRSHGFRRRARWPIGALLLVQARFFHGLLSVVCLGWAMAHLRQRPTVQEKRGVISAACGQTSS